MNFCVFFKEAVKRSYKDATDFEIKKVVATKLKNSQAKLNRDRKLEEGDGLDDIDSRLSEA